MLQETLCPLTNSPEYMASLFSWTKREGTQPARNGGPERGSTRLEAVEERRVNLGPTALLCSDMASWARYIPATLFCPCHVIYTGSLALGSLGQAFAGLP